jgi:hypothetical protein
MFFELSSRKASVSLSSRYLYYIYIYIKLLSDDPYPAFTRPLESERIGKDRAHPLKFKPFKPDPLKSLIKFDPYSAIS